MKIYRVIVWFRGTPEYHFVATKKEASLHIKAAREECAEGIATGSDFSADIETVVYPSSRQGLAKALNDFVRMTCINDG